MLPGERDMKLNKVQFLLGHLDGPLKHDFFRHNEPLGLQDIELSGVFEAMTADQSAFPASETSYMGSEGEDGAPVMTIATASSEPDWERGPSSYFEGGYTWGIKIRQCL